jgi:hypothetical protein
MKAHKESHGCYLLLLAGISIFAMLMYIESRKAERLLQEDLLVKTIGYIYKKREGVYFRNHDTSIKYSYIVDGKGFNDSFLTSEPALYEIGEKIEVWYSRGNPKYNKVRTKE